MADERNLGQMTTNMSSRNSTFPVDYKEDYPEEYDYGTYDNYDFSKFLFPNQRPTKPAWEYALKISLCVIIVLVSLIGNSLVIYVVAMNKRMRTTTNYYIVNLAVADLMVTLCCTWVQCYDDLSPKWPLGSFLCKFNTFAQVLSMVSSVLTLTVIACDRFFGIVFAMKAHMTERRASVFITLVWVVSIAVSSPLLYFRRITTREWKDYTEIFCQDHWPFVTSRNEQGMVMAFTPSRVAYYTTVSIILFFLPVLIMSIAYSLIIMRLRSSRMPGVHLDTEMSVQDKLKKKVVVMLVMILSVFVICWLPYQVILVYGEHRTEQSELPAWYRQLQFYAIYIGYTNSAVNPIIYAGFNENFQKGLKNVSLRKASRTL
ncbi:pyroglutamylated RF-amide peptide receptor-like isoform X2 [Lineus longissimus]|uniref:pyroglutamylated RF-amide peptide receptor-like isoform X2 n=1 Tax=Lineus longissimus TaxID=88925 RepID=UPI00315CCEF2